MIMENTLRKTVKEEYFRKNKLERGIKMKLNEDFSVCEIEGKTFLAPIGASVIDLRNMFNLNETGAFLTQLLEEHDMTKEELVAALLAEFEVEETQASTDLDEFVEKGKEIGFIVE